MKLQQSKIKIEAVDFGGLKISDASKIKSIRIKVEASHAGIINKNNFLYVPTAMQDGVDTFIGNPVIHGHSEDNLNDENQHFGYIDDAKYIHYEEYGEDVLDFDSIDDIIGVLEEFETRKLYDSSVEYKGLGHIELVATISKPDAIKKILDGTYSDVSIGGEAKDVYCSICSSNIGHTKDVCHKRGKVYDGEQCYWIGDSITYEELSFVETPADPHVKTVVLKDSESGYDNGKIKILDFVLHDSEEPIVKKIKATEFSQRANELMAVRMKEIGIYDEATYVADSYKDLKASDFLIAGEKILPIHDAAHLLVAREIVESIDNEGVEVADQLDVSAFQSVLARRTKKIFKTEEVNIADELQKITDSVVAEKAKAVPVVEGGEGAGAGEPVTEGGEKSFDRTLLNFKDEAYNGKKFADMDESELGELREKLPCDEWGVWELRCALSQMISATMSVDKMAEVVKGALNELFPGGTGKMQDSYVAKRLVILEDEAAAFEAEAVSLRDKLKKQLVHNILVAENKLTDSVYKEKLMKRELISLEDKLQDLMPEAVESAEKVEQNEQTVDISDAVSQNTDDQESEGGEKITDGEQPDVKTQLNPTEIRDQYKKTMREKGLTAATNLIKDLKQQGKVPSNFKL